MDAFEGSVWIVSKAGGRTEAPTRQWFELWDFFDSTGLSEDHVRFCRERTDKLPVCLELGINHFIDERIHIMQILRGAVAYLYLFGDKTQNRSARRWVTLVVHGDEAYEAIVRNLLRSSGEGAG